jgi:hypothetical protein
MKRFRILFLGVIVASSLILVHATVAGGPFAGAADAGKVQDSNKGEPAQLDGAWDLVDCDIGGHVIGYHPDGKIGPSYALLMVCYGAKPSKKAPAAQRMRWQFVRDKLIVEADLESDDKGSRSKFGEFVCRFGGKDKPWAMDLIYQPRVPGVGLHQERAQVIAGIYRREDNKLEVMLSRFGEERPRDWKPDSHSYRLVLQKVGKGAAAQPKGQVPRVGQSPETHSQAGDLAFVPPDAAGFARLAMGRIWDSEAGQGVRRQLDKATADELHKVEEKLGIPLRDLEAVTMVVLPPMDDAWTTSPILLAFTTKVPYRRAGIERALVPESQKFSSGGKEYLVAGEQPGDALFFFNNRTFLVASSSAMGAYLASSTRPPPGEPLADAIKMALEDHAFVAGFRVPAAWDREMRMKIRGLIPGDQPDWVIRFLNQQPLLDVESGTVVVDLGAKALLHARLRFPDEETAKDAADTLRVGLGGFRRVITAVLEEAKKDRTEQEYGDPLVTRVKEDQTMATLLRETREVLSSAHVHPERTAVDVSAETKAMVALAVPTLKMVCTKLQTQSSDNLKRIVLAMHMYHDTFGRLPSAAIRDKEGKPLLSWRVAILPFLEEDGLYRQFKLDEPWDSPHNKKLLGLMPRVYAPDHIPAKAPNTTFWQVFAGKGSVFENPKGIALGTIGDGMSNTIMIIEAAQSVPWTKPEDLPFDPDKPLPRVGAEFPNGFLVAFCDGSVHLLSKAIDPKVLRALITCNGGEVVNQADMKDLWRP